MYALTANNLTKSYGKNIALNNFSIKIKKGTIHALLGHNGSGKTTFVKICSTLLKPNSGEVIIFDKDVAKNPAGVREHISLNGQSASIDEELTGYENLFLVARLQGLSSSEAKVRANELLLFFGLTDAAKRLVKNYSGGMRRKLDLAASIILTPDILFLDEPTTGLDPISRHQLWDIIRELSREGTTILLTTQYLEEADILADTITLLNQGQVISEGTSDQLKALAGENILHLTLGEDFSTYSSSVFFNQLLGNAIEKNEKKQKIIH